MDFLYVFVKVTFYGNLISYLKDEKNHPTTPDL
jgi:hypothetical protein